MYDSDLDHYLAIARQAVLTAGSQVKHLRTQAKIHHIKEGGDLVTEGDLAAEESVLATLQHHFPSHAFNSEERGQSHPAPGMPAVANEFTWILDPIDGTKYYAADVPLYSVSLALKYRDEPVIGVVYAPEFDRLYCAASGRGATVNSRPTACSTITDLSRATLCLEIPNINSPPEVQRCAMQQMAALVNQAFRVRIIGVSALGLCMTAGCGFDAYLNLTGDIDIVDVAAGWVVLRESGAQVQMIGPNLLAGPADLCRQIRAVVNI